ncbi:hypothetical protein [Halolamina sp. C58]|uniref:hypothetical protein n=1 Tax=Halolamina sp. C58 TaxID=3421640 RepID=UPI003EBBEEBB
MSQNQQFDDDISVDSIPIDLSNTHSGDVAPDEVPAEIESITLALTNEQPPTNPLVVLKAARWWYLHGTGGTDPAFTWAIEWTRHLATGEPSDSAHFDAFCEYLVTVGLADDRHELR